MYADHRHGHNFWQALRLLDGASVGAVLASRRGKTQPPVTGKSVWWAVSEEAQERQMGAQVAPLRRPEPRFNLQQPHKAPAKRKEFTVNPCDITTKVALSVSKIYI